MMTVRGFSWGDLDGVVRVHNAAALADGQPVGMTAEAFTARWQAFGGRPELNLWVIAGASDEVLAYGGLRPWHSPGWLQAEIVVRPDLQRRGLGSALLERLLAAAGEQWRATYLIAITPDEPPGAGAFLQRHGFEPFVPRLHMRLRPPAAEPVPPVPGHRLRVAGPEESDVLAELTNVAYSSNERVGAADGPGFRRYMLESQVQVWAAEDLHLRRVVGLCEVTERKVALDGRMVASGHIGSLAVHPRSRGRGLGRWLLAAGIELCRRAGRPSVELNVDRDNAPALGLYESMGFRPVYAFTVYRKVLAAAW